MKRSDLIYMPYSKARKKIRNADLLQFRSRDWYTPAIGIAGETEYVHSAMAGRAWERVLCIQMTSGAGRGAVPLSSIVEQYPGCVDVYASRNEVTLREGKTQNFCRNGAVAKMFDITGRLYGWRNLAQVACVHLPLIRFFVRPKTDDLSDSPWPPFCSAAVSQACRLGGGVDPYPDLADCYTEPGHIYRGPLYGGRYLFTLVPDDWVGGMTPEKLAKLPPNWGKVDGKVF